MKIQNDQKYRTNCNLSDRFFVIVWISNLQILNYSVLSFNEWANCNNVISNRPAKDFFMILFTLLEIILLQLYDA